MNNYSTNALALASFFNLLYKAISANESVGVTNTHEVGRFVDAAAPKSCLLGT